MMRTLACLNGELMPVEEAKVSVWDRGFLFGDSIYEVFRLHSGRCWLETEHVGRLRRSLGAMGFPEVDLESLMERVGRTVEASAVEEGTVYIQITRGVAPRLHAYPDPPVPPTELILVRPYDDTATALLRESGVKVISHPDLRWGRCDVKSTNLLANVIANEAAHRAGAYEAVLYTDDEFVTEATHSSLLWYRDGKLQGTPEGPEILPGTTRILALRLAESIGVPFEECRVTLDELVEASEVVLLGTTIEILAVTAIDDKMIGGGRPGPIASRLQIAYHEAVRDWLGVESVTHG